MQYRVVLDKAVILSTSFLPKSTNFGKCSTSRITAKGKTAFGSGRKILTSLFLLCITISFSRCVVGG